MLGIKLTKNVLGYTLGDFSQTHLVTLTARHYACLSADGVKKRIARIMKLFTRQLCHSSDERLPGYRVARWFAFKPKILFCVKFGGP
jgi:hypothetical protein